MAGTTPILVHNTNCPNGSYDQLTADHKAAPTGRYLYRGVPEGHPGFSNAEEGAAIPRGVRQMALFGEDKWGESEVLVQNPVEGATIFDMREP
ncbi:hypothetical protein AB0D30_34260 [Streptomyces sp. NPDC048409]|uniref:hypothetical protein n=1 Tax=Streptomyces sp. NPDC048409 TaxID=3154723 RepID=UPI003446404A